MKFAKQLEDEAIPEWKANYLDYKTAKKRLKVVNKAVRNVASSTRSRTTPGSSSRDGPPPSVRGGDKKGTKGPGTTLALHSRLTRSRSEISSPHGHLGGDSAAEWTPHPNPVSERSPLRIKQDHQPDRLNGDQRMASYGSIIGSPPNNSSIRLKQQVPSLELPDRAFGSEDSPGIHKTFTQSSAHEQRRGEWYGDRFDESLTTQRRETDVSAIQPTYPGNAHDVRDPNTISLASGELHKSRLRRLIPKKISPTPDVRPFVKRMFSVPAGSSPGTVRSDDDIALESYQELDFRKAEFFLFLDKEFLKIESFYKSKEDEATERLNVLREQLHIMREFRLEQIVAAEQKHKHPEPTATPNDAVHENGHATLSSSTQKLNDESNAERRNTKDLLFHPIAKSVDFAADALNKVRPGHVGKTSTAMGSLGTPRFGGNWLPDPDRRDYTRRPTTKEIPYRVAKRKMKAALAEYYRGLELLKSYAILNRTAFRKINKKYDKVANARPKLQFMEEKVNKSHFVNSDVVDKLLQTVEDLYARYFERGKHKIAVNKLRAKTSRAGDYSGPVARTCALLGAGAVFSVQAMVHASEDLLHPAVPGRHVQAEYLLQLYAGYFLILLLSALFCLDAGIFSRYKINYQFIFELDARNNLNWRQISEIPAWLFLLLGLTMWLNFTHVGGNDMYLYWFVILLAITAVFLFLPAPVLYHRARSWILYSCWRLLAAGIYPVEFRDFFLGDMFCSLTYATGNIELFFCVYARRFSDPEKCNSSHSRLLGFFSTLPGIWRALQCIRRYWDTGNIFPHLVNCGKYTFTILYYLTLSLYRINKIPQLKALFIACATINGVYCSVWDIMMDWSLSDAYAKHPLLRQTIVYRKHVWFYYVAMVLDPILRFNWIFYAIYTEDLQHSTLVAFFVAFSEVLRRGMWTLLRVENEQSTNIVKERASRDIELPYEIPEETSTDNLLNHERKMTSKLSKRQAEAGSPKSDSSELSDHVDPSKQHANENGPTEDNSASNQNKNLNRTETNREGDITRVKTNETAKSTLSAKATPSRGTGRASSPSQNTTEQNTNVAMTPFQLLGVRFWNSSTKNTSLPTTVEFQDNDRLEQNASSGSTHSDEMRPPRPSRSDTMGSAYIVDSLHRVGNTMRRAHAQDYERKKKTNETTEAARDSDEEEDDEEDEDSDTS